ncbi:S41 family peptidase [Alteromonas hispanica]|uniref:Peptidase n=1 Tax=Alteromonas hispanica TaxID=315421 RepID=A0A6L9MVT5_9ALTE|nr:S41 family peptidase [Alteromonas hispanica]NDW22322.1 peptidase [Alteromonas hispanica]
MKVVDVKSWFSLACIVTALSACGGSGSSSTTPDPISVAPPAAETPSEPVWQAGVYEPESEFINQCVAPRSGIDPFSGNAYPDEQGTAMDEKLWMRSWTNDTYLWYDEVEDNDPANFTIAGYFDQLKTTELTPTGTLKDNFHFSRATDEYNTLTQTGVSSGYGFEWEFVSLVTPRELIVQYTEPNSPAAQAGIPRGASLKTVDGVDFVNANTQEAVDVINAGLFPSESGKTTNFTFDLVDGSELTVSVTSANIEVSPVQNVRILDTDIGKVGYFQFNTFIRTAQDSLISTFEQFIDNNVTELVIDLRYNGGGLLALASQLSYMVAGPNQTNNAIFETLQFNDKYPTTNPVTGGTIRPTPFYSNEIDYNEGVLTNRLLPSLSVSTVYVITTGSTCSASEAVINSLRGIDVEVVQIGSPTCGKPYGFYPTDNCGTTYFTIQFQGVNNKGFGDFADGFIPTSTPNFAFELPGCSVADDFTNPLGDANEGMLAAALAYAQTGSCPASAAGTEGTAVAEQSQQVQSSFGTAKTSLAIKAPHRERDALILHNKINEPILREKQ